MDIILSDYQNHLTNVLRYLTDFCERNDVRYFVAYGTMLGAVRHKGFIPWDDDADIFIPRDDYERLLNMKELLQQEGFDIISMESKDSYLTYAKVYDSSTSLWEVKQYPHMIGVFVDIFPLDYADCPPNEVAKSIDIFKRYSRHFSLAYAHYKIGDLLFYIKGFHLKTAWDVLLSFYYRKRKNHYRIKMFELCDSLHKTGGKYCVDYSSAVNEKNPYNFIYESEWFNDYILTPFYDFQVRIPVGYDAYLKCRYGDYMQLPPLSARVPQHSHYFLDLKKHWTIEEVVLLNEKNKD